MNHYDIVVCGAGIAGTAAALAAARKGKKVAVIEKQTVVGGLATSGLIYIYLPISGSDGRIVTSGIAEELLCHSVAYGPFDLPENYSKVPGGDSGRYAGRVECCFSPAGYTLTLEKLLREAGVDLWLDTSVIEVRCDSQNRICEAGLFCGFERWNVSADCFIDASGGAYMLQMAGEKVFGEVNYITPWFIEYGDGSLRRETGPLAENLTVNHFCGSWENSMNSVIHAGEMQEFIRRQYQEIRRHFDKVDDKSKLFPVHLPAMPQTRKIARIDGMSLITDGDCGVYREDSIGVAADWRKLAPSWETPYGALVPRRVRGALAAGRCINSAGDAWEIFRVIPAAAMTGEAAGAAAAMAIDRGIDPAEVPVADLQADLRQNNVILHIAESKEATL